MSLSFLFFIFLGYILYRFIVGFVLPVAKTARGMKKQFDQMKQQPGYAANEQATDDNRKQTESFAGKDGDHQQRTTSGRKGAKEDYIDFEELPASKF